MTPRFGLHLICACLVVSCGSSPEVTEQATDVGSDSTTDEESTGQAEGSAGDPPDSPPFVPLDAQGVCDHLLACADRRTPSQYGDFFPQFGATGSCWADFSAPECELACIEAIGVLGCDFCNSAFACPCDPDTHTCVECLGDSDCPERSPRCNATTSQCAACLEDEHCQFSECPDQSGVCTAQQQCEFSYTDVFEFTVEATDLGQWEGARLFLRTANSPIECGPGFYQFTAIESGQAEFTVFGQVAQGLELWLVVDVDGNSIDGADEPTARVQLGAARPAKVVITGADFQTE